MSSQTATQTARGNTRRGRGGNRGGRGGNRGAGGNKPQVQSPLAANAAAAATPAITNDKSKKLAEAKAAAETVAADDAEVCWICAEPVKFYSVSDCDHRTCHVCALRLRALYKKTDCTFCKVNLPPDLLYVNPHVDVFVDPRHPSRQ